MRLFREAYIGAVFPFFGQRYHVRAYEEHAVVLDECEPHLRTDPVFFNVITKSDFFDGLGYGDIAVYYGSLDIVMNFAGYELVNESSDETIGTGGNDDARRLKDLHSFWLDVPTSTIAVEGIGAVEHMIRVGALFVITADRFDTSTHSTKVGNVLSTHYYENYPAASASPRSC